jgi:hypothetical protein
MTRFIKHWFDHVGMLEQLKVYLSNHYNEAYCDNRCRFDCGCILLIYADHKQRCFESSLRGGATSIVASISQNQPTAAPATPA